MNIMIHPDLFELFPGLTVKGLVATNIQTERLPDQTGTTQFKLKQDYDTKALIKQWQKVYKQFPTDKKARCSIEYLIWAFQKEKLRNIHPLVDLYNQASLMTLCPFGGEDIDRVGKQLILRQATGTEKFIPLGKTEAEQPQAQEVIWANGENQVVCRSLNWLESDAYKITESSKNIVFVSEQISEAFPDADKGVQLLQERLQPVSDQVFTFCLNKEHHQLDVPF